MAVTRSATQAARQLTRSKTTTRNVTKGKINKENALKKRTTDSNEKKVIIRAPPHRERLIEWIALEDPTDGIIPDKSEIFSVLQDLRRRKGCQVVARAHPLELSGIEWLVIEWQDQATRDRFLESELSERLTQALAARSPKKELIWPINCWDFHRVIRADPRYPPQKLYEIFTTYFPVKLDDTTVTTLESLAPRCDFPEELVPNPGGQWHDQYADFAEWHCGQSPEEGEPVAVETVNLAANTSMDGFLYHERAWMEGEVEFGGQPARRLIHVFRFEDEEGERCYKE